MTRRVASTAVQVAAGLFLVLGAAVFSAWADDPPIREFFLGPFSFPRGIALGPDCHLWFTEAGANKIGKITPEGVITEYDTNLTPNSIPDGIALGADGNLWFTEGNTNKIGQITPTGGITEFTIPTPGAGPAGITSEPAGALWFTERNGNIWRITTAGQFTEFPVPTPGSGITRGPDGNLWFTAANKIGRITPTGAVTEFAIPTPDSGPAGITSGPDGALWFTELIGNKIGRITTAGAITEFPIPTSASQPIGIAPGPDGNLWFTEIGANKIGWITPAGMITELTRLVSRPYGITLGPGGLWFTENSSAGIIGQIMVGSGSPDFTVGASPSSQTVTPGGATSYGVTINPTNCFSGQVTLDVSGLPSGANGDFNPNPATASSTFSVTTSASTPIGTYPLTITGVSGSLTHTAMVSLVVSPGDFALGASPASQTVPPGDGTSYGVTINPMGGFSGQVTLTVSGLPSGANGDFSPNPATASSTLSVTTSASTPTGTYPLTITGVSDGLMHTAMVSLVVTGPSLVVNGGFETGDFTGWTQGGNLDATFVRSPRPHSGQFAAELGPVFSQGFLSQTVPTVAGTTYDFDFWLRADSNLPLKPRNVFQVSLNGVVMFTEIIRALGHDYQLHTFSFTATGPTALRFDVRHDFGYFTLDDVSIRPR